MADKVRSVRWSETVLVIEGGLLVEKRVHSLREGPITVHRAPTAMAAHRMMHSRPFVVSAPRRRNKAKRTVAA